MDATSHTLDVFSDILTPAVLFAGLQKDVSTQSCLIDRLDMTDRPTLKLL